MNARTRGSFDIDTVAITDISLRTVSYYVEEYLAGRKLSPRDEAVAKAAIALQEAYTMKDYQAYVPKQDTVDPVDAQREEYDYHRALNAFNGGFLHKGVSWGVPRAQINAKPSMGEYMTLHYNSLSERATVAGYVVAINEYQDGRGFVIRMMESHHGFNIESPTGWRYAALWVPRNLNKMCGFLQP